MWKKPICCNRPFLRDVVFPAHHLFTKCFTFVAEANWCSYVKCTWQKKYPNPGTDAPITFYRGGMSNYLHNKRKYQVKTPKIEQLNAKPLPNKGHCRRVFLILHEIACEWWRETRNTPWKHHRKPSLSSQPRTVTESHKDNLVVKGHQQHKMLYPPKQ